MGVLNVGDLTSILSAWKTKYELPDEVVSSLQSLVSIVSSDYKQTHKVLQSTAGQVKVVAAGGRNYNGQISIAFVFGTNSRSVTKHALSNSCDGSKCALKKTFPGHCKVDGSTTSVTCCTACDREACKEVYRNNCDGLPTNRPFSAAESTAILQSLQSGIFSKIQAEAALLENELRSGSLYFARSINASSPTHLVV